MSKSFSDTCNICCRALVCNFGLRSHVADWLYNRGSSTDQMRRRGDGRETLWPWGPLSYSENPNIVKHRETATHLALSESWGPPTAPHISRTLKHREHDAHDDQRDLNPHFRLPNSWNDQFLTTSISQYLVATEQLITSGGHGVPAVTKTGLLSAKTARMAWQMNFEWFPSLLGFDHATVGRMCVFMCVYIYIYVYTQVYT